MADPEKPSPDDVTPAEAGRAGKAAPRRRGAQAGRMKVGQRPGPRDTAPPYPADREKFAAWLATKDRRWSVVLAARAALRGVPLVIGTESGKYESVILAVFRAAAISWFAAVFPDDEIPPDAVNSAARAADAFARAYADAAALATAAAAVRAVAAADEVRASASTADVLHFFAFDVAGIEPSGFEKAHPRYADVISVGLGDLRRLMDGVSPSDVARSPLWSDTAGGQPDWAERAWGELLGLLAHTSDGNWRVWANWYADVLAGRTHGEAWDAAFVDLDPDDPLPWDDGPKAVNERIADRLAKLARAEQSEQQPGSEARSDDSPPEIPKARPAAIEPVWTDGTLSLAREPVAVDLDPDALAGALAALKDELSDLADEAAGYPQLDQRPPAYLREIAGRIPGSAPAQAELFRLGHAKEVLDRFRRTVDAEWPDLLAARYHALLLQFDRTARQFPKWRAFIQNAARVRLTPDQIAEVPRLVEPIVAELESPEGQAVVDPAIPQALRNLVRPIGLTEQEAEALDAGMDALAVDVLESINNILKSLAEPALVVGAAAKRYARGFLKEADKSLEKQFKQWGKGVGPALDRLLKRLTKVTVYGGSGLTGAAFLLKRLYKVFPEQFGWLESLLRFLELV